MNSENGKNSNVDQPEGHTTSPGGVFLTQGMKITIPEGGLTLRLSDEGNIEGTVLALHVGLDMCPYWLRIACEHLVAAELNNKNVHLALTASNDEQLGLALEKEFATAMQAITAAAFAIDAFYAMVKERIDIQQEVLDAWKKNGTARKKQIYEVLRYAFSMGPDSEKQMWEIIDHIVHFRDLAVHPSAKLSAPILHPELQKGTEWRFVMYRFQNAKPAVSAVLSLVAQLAPRYKQKYPRLKQYCEDLERSVAPIVEVWEHKYGLLYSRTTED